MICKWYSVVTGTPFIDETFQHYKQMYKKQGYNQTTRSNLFPYVLRNGHEKVIVIAIVIGINIGKGLGDDNTAVATYPLVLMVDHPMLTMA